MNKKILCLLFIFCLIIIPSVKAFDGTPEEIIGEVKDFIVSAQLKVDGSVSYKQTFAITYEHNITTGYMVLDTSLPADSNVYPNIEVRELISNTYLTETYLSDFSAGCINRYVFDKQTNRLEICLPVRKEIKLEVTAIILPKTSYECKSSERIYNNLTIVMLSSPTDYYASVDVLGGDGVKFDDPASNACGDIGKINISSLGLYPMENGFKCQGQILKNKYGFELTIVLSGNNSILINQQKEERIEKIDTENKEASIRASYSAIISAAVAIVMIFLVAFQIVKSKKLFEETKKINETNLVLDLYKIETENRRRLIDIGASYNKLRDKRSKKAEYERYEDEIVQYLNLYEIFAGLILKGRLNESESKDNWKETIIYVVESYRELIDRARKGKGNKNQFCKLLKLYDKWRG